MQRETAEARDVRRRGETRSDRRRSDGRALRNSPARLDPRTLVGDVVLTLRPIAQRFAKINAFD